MNKKLILTLAGLTLIHGLNFTTPTFAKIAPTSSPFIPKPKLEQTLEEDIILCQTITPSSLKPTSILLQTDQGYTIESYAHQTTFRYDHNLMPTQTTIQSRNLTYDFKQQKVFKDGKEIRNLPQLYQKEKEIEQDIARITQMGNSLLDRKETLIKEYALAKTQREKEIIVTTKKIIEQRFARTKEYRENAKARLKFNDSLISDYQTALQNAQTCLDQYAPCLE